MWSTDVLREEHRWILRLLLCLEQLCAAAEREGRLQAESAAETMALLVHFAGGLHQEREESCLFPRLLARARTVAERQHVARLCGEHEAERQAMQRMGHELLGAVYGRAGSLGIFMREARQVIELHRRHLVHENQELLPLADALLTRQDDANLLQAYARLERTDDARRVFLRIETLCLRLGVGQAIPT